MIKEYKDKNGNKKYLFKVYLGTDFITGKQKRTTRRGFNTEREAKLAEAKLLMEVDEYGFAGNTNSSFKEVYELWLETYQTTVKESTYWKTKQIFEKHILPKFGKLKVKAITVAFVQKQLNAWAKEYTKYRTYLNYTSKVMKFAVNMSMINQNVCEKVILPKAKTKKRANNFYNKEQLQTFFKAWGNEENLMHQTYFRLLAYSGMRKGEALALKWSDLNLKDHTVTIDKTVTIGDKGLVIISETPKNSYSERTIDIDKETFKLLLKWRKEQKKLLLMDGFNALAPNQLMFSNQHNTAIHPSHIANVLKRFVNRHGLDAITPHGFRHTHCSLLLEAGVPIKEVQERLGHSDIKTTMNIYAHVTKKDEYDTGMKFADFIGK